MTSTPITSTENSTEVCNPVGSCGTYGRLGASVCISLARNANAMAGDRAEHPADPTEHDHRDVLDADLDAEVLDGDRPLLQREHAAGDAREERRRAERDQLGAHRVDAEGTTKKLLQAPTSLAREPRPVTLAELMLELESSNA
jgi:hypothetical protein